MMEITIAVNSAPWHFVAPFLFLKVVWRQLLVLRNRSCKWKVILGETKQNKYSLCTRQRGEVPLCVWDLFLFSNLVSNRKRLRGASDFITVQGQFICRLWDPGLDILGSKRLLPSPLLLGWFGEFRRGLGGVSAPSQVL